jgi:hypothetical protein
MGALYDRRMTAEEHYLKTTGGRFGVRLEWTALRTPAHLARFTLLVGVGLWLWTAQTIFHDAAHPSHIVLPVVPCP